MKQPVDQVMGLLAIQNQSDVVGRNSKCQLHHEWIFGFVGKLTRWVASPEYPTFRHRYIRSFQKIPLCILVFKSQQVCQFGNVGNCIPWWIASISRFPRSLLLDAFQKYHINPSQWCRASNNPSSYASTMTTSCPAQEASSSQRCENDCLLPLISGVLSLCIAIRSLFSFCFSMISFTHPKVSIVLIKFIGSNPGIGKINALFL